MNIAKFFIDRKILTWTMSLVFFAAGVSAYRTIGRLEDPEYTIKVAQVVTYWPGATAAVARLRPRIEELVATFPEGYRVEWGGEVESCSSTSPSASWRCWACSRSSGCRSRTRS